MNAVVFDMDGLMFDTERLCMMACDYAGEKAGIGKAGYTVLKTLGTNAALTRQILRKEFGENYPEEEMKHYMEEFRTQYYAQYGMPVKKGLFSLLAYLKNAGYKMAVASSTSQAGVERNLRMAEVYEYFSAVICGDMIEKSKPEPDIYAKACAALGEKPEDCYALEDSRNGLLSASRAGCRVIMVPDLWQPDEAIRPILWKICSDLDEVKEYLIQNEETTG